MTEPFILSKPAEEIPMKYSVRWAVVFGFLLTFGTSALLASVGRKHNTENIVFVMTDGLRWQEVFRGADQSLMNKENGGVADVPSLQKAYWRETVEDRRLALMPFLWHVIAEQGQIYGNRSKGSDAYVTNGLNFSYPGYSETLCGFADLHIDSNDKISNPNVTVLEWLNHRRPYQNRVVAFAAWDVFPFIFNAARAGFPVDAGYDPVTTIPITPRLGLLNRLKGDGPRIWDDEPFDGMTFYTALEYLKTRKPRILYLSLGETDDWAHQGNYAEYLNAAHRVDAYIESLWETAQSMRQYRGKTTLIFSPDHGRGDGPVAWKDHGEKIPSSKNIWMAFLGPDTPALGERSNIPGVRQDQIAATLAAFLGEDYISDVPKAGKRISDAISSDQKTGRASY
jgi:hypothetical protein